MDVHGDKTNPAGPSHTLERKDNRTTNVYVMNIDTDSHLSSDGSHDDHPIDVTRDKTNPAIYIRKTINSSTKKGRNEKTLRVHNM